MSRLIDAEHFEQMLIDLIDNGDHKNAYVHHAYKMRNIAIKECRKMLWEEPTVNAVPTEHGKWIRLANGRHECSICHIFAPSFMDGKENESYYCPLCGAKMDEVTE